jgi:cell division septum initiation protein DivIVA
VTDNRMKDRVKVMFNGTHPEGATSEHALINPNGQGVPSAQALQVLTMAQRTAEEHLARAQHEADKIRTEALAAAEEIGREAQMHAHNVRREAEQVLLDARAGAEQTARDAQMRAEEAQRSAAKVVLEARSEAGRITADAQANADQLRLAAQQRYDDVVGSLGARREALQQQIEALERFDREYRARLTGFMQTQLRALWVDQPQVAGELPHEEAAVVAEVVEDAEPAQDEAQAAEDDEDVRGGRHGVHASRDE